MTARWIRWTETLTPPDAVGDVLVVARDADGTPRDYRIGPPSPTAYLPCPRPASAPVQPPEEVSVPVRITVNDWGPRKPTVEPVTAWIEVGLTGHVAGDIDVDLRANGDMLDSVLDLAPSTVAIRLEGVMLGAGVYPLVVSAIDEQERVLDRTATPRIVTVLPAAPAPVPPSPAGPVRTIHTAHDTYLRVQPGGEVDAGGQGKGPWESVSVQEVG